MPLIQLDTNYHRSLSVTLGLLDEGLCKFEDWAHGRVRNGVMYHEHDTLSEAQKAAILREIAAARTVMARLRDDLGLDPTVHQTSRMLWGQCSAFWEMAVDLETARMRGYGEPPAGLAAILDPQAQALLAVINRLSGLVSRRG